MSDHLSHTELKILPCHDPDLLGRLMPMAKAEGFNFIDRLFSEWFSGTNRFQNEGETLLMIEVGGVLVGCGGLTRQRERLGRMRRVYIDPDFRNRGMGKALVETLVKSARESFDEIVLFTDNPNAARLYEQLGFVPEDPRSTPDHATHRLVLEPI